MKIDIKETPTQHYRERVRVIKDKLPRNYRKIIYSHYPELKTEEGKTLIDCTLQLVRTHRQLTEVLEDIAAGKLKLKGTKELELNKEAA